MITKLKDLKPGMADWHTIGYVKSRIELRPYKADNKSKWFDFKFSDDEHTIRVVCFTDVSTKFDKIIEVGKYYTVKDGTIQQTYFKGNSSIEIILTANSELKQRTEADIDFEVPKFPCFDSIIDVGSTKKSKLNIIGFIKSASEEEQVIVDGKSTIKKQYTMYDENGQINVTFWNRSEELKKNDLVAVEDGTVKTYQGGKYINVGTSSNVTINPECGEAERLKKWKNSQNDENMSQKLDLSYCSQLGEQNSSSFSTDELMQSAIQELQDVEEQQQKLDIKRIRLTQEIERYKSL